MPSSAADSVKAESSKLSGEELLRSPVSILLGVSDAVRTALESLGIRTVFDLAASDLFATAALLLAIESDPTLAEARLNAVAADAVTPPHGVPAAELARHSIAILKGIDPARAAELATTLDVASVRDLALWPPYRTAREILADTFVPGAALTPDAEAPPELLPKSGVYPTERVFYRKLLIDVAPPPTGGSALEDVGPIDLDVALAAPTAFDRLATGALLTFSQSWFSQGLTLGQLLHSTSLAPGESTRIAMIDWTRRSRASASESIGETEELANTQTHNRALSEVTEATATEFQAGTSQTSVTSRTGQAGSASGLELGPLAIGRSGGFSTTTTDAMSASTSFGTRDLAAEFAQTINDRSQQNASSARTRRASIVREVSQEEHETISTRVVTNYNHMHALTVQYYEVVQAFRVTTQMDRAERCLFVPLKLVNFRDAATVDRLRSVLAAAALTAKVYRQLTSEYGVVEVIPQTPRLLPGRFAVMDFSVMATLASTTTTARRLPDVVAGTGGVRESAATAPAAPATPVVTAPFEPGTESTPLAMLAIKGWNLDQVNRIGLFGGRSPLRSGSDSVFVSDETTLLSVSLRDAHAGKFRIRKRDNTEMAALEWSATTFILGAPALVSELQSIAVQNAAGHDVKASLVLHLSVNGSTVPLDVPIQLRPGGAGASLQEIVRFGAVRASGELVDHLEANRLHYSRAVFRTLDVAAIAALLARFTYRGLPLPQVVEPQPLAVTANYLVFRVNVPLDRNLEDDRFRPEQDAWRNFLSRRGLDKPVPKTEVVPLPSGGVFAEAVLGRFNSAEKIDLKRFWNWQDSPIPESAPEIAAITAGSRAHAEDLKPGQLGAPVVTIQAPNALPAAAGVGPMLNAIQNGAMFRDMSGMVQTAALAQAAAQASGAGATSAGDQAAKNLFTVMDQHTQRMKIAADLAGSMMGAPPAGGGGAAGGDKAAAGRGTSTERGIQLAAAKALDQKNAAAAAGGAAGAAGAGASATGAGAPGPATLESEVLNAQTGTDAARAAEKIIDSATAPVTAPKKVKAKKPTRVTPTESTPATPSAPAPSTPPALPSDLFGPGPRRFLLQIRLEPTDGVTATGGWGIRVHDNEGLKFDLANTHDARISAGFSTDSATVTLEIKALSKPQGRELEGFQRLLLPQSIFRTTTTTVNVTVRPILKTITRTIPALGGTFAPDLNALEQQLIAANVTPEKRIGDPKLEFASMAPLSFKATVRYFKAELLIQQIIE